MDQKSAPVEGSTERAPAMLRAEIAHTRAQMGATIEALHGRLNPTVLKEQALDSFHEAKATVADELKEGFAHAKELLKGELNEAKAAVKHELAAELENAKTKLSEEYRHAKATVRGATIGKVEHMVHEAKDTLRTTGHTVLDTIKANPIPATLIGAGLAWLFISVRQQRSRRFDVIEDEPQRGHILAERGFDTASNTAGGFRDKVAGAAHDAGANIASAAHTAADAVSHAAHQATESVGTFAHRAGEKAVELGKGTKRQVIRLQKGSASAYRANPIAVGAAVLAVGTAIGLAIPSTQREDALMGAKRDELFEKAQGMAHDALETVEEAGKKLVDTEMKKPQHVDGVQAASAPPDHHPRTI